MAGQEHCREDLGLLDDDAAARPDDPHELAQRALGIHDVVQHVAAPNPVHAPVGQGNRGPVARLELEPVSRGLAAHERPRGLHLGLLRLDRHDPAVLAHRLGQPERVEPDAAAHVEPARAGRQPQLADDPPRFRLLEAVHPLERDVGAEIHRRHGRRHPTRRPTPRGARIPRTTG
jgi:hypothetical protein